MFGVDFSELMVIMVVALIVIGPERLPKVARTAGLLWGRAQRYINGIKADINNIKDDITHGMSIEEIKQMQQKMNQEVLRLEQETNKVTQSVNQQVQQLNSAVVQAVPQAVVQQAQPGPQPVAEQKKISVN